MAPRTRASAMGAETAETVIGEADVDATRRARGGAGGGAGDDEEERKRFRGDFGERVALREGIREARCVRGGEQVRALEVALELETARRRERARSRAQMNDERWTDEGVV